MKHRQKICIMCLSKGVAAIELATKEGLLANKTLGFIPTAGDVYEDPYFVQDSRRRLERLGFKLTELDIARERGGAIGKTGRTRRSICSGRQLILSAARDSAHKPIRTPH